MLFNNLITSQHQGRLLQEYTYKGSYTYIYTDQDSYELLAQIFDNAKDGKQYLSYFHTDQIGIPREMTDIHGNLLWYGEYTAWGRLKKDELVYRNAHQPFRLQNQYFDEETGLHYNLMRYYEPEAGRFVNQDPIGLLGGENLYWFAPNVQDWVDPLGLSVWKDQGLDFKTWFDQASVKDISDNIKDVKSTSGLRFGGGKHEHFPVSLAVKAKELGFTADELEKMATPTKNIYFVDVTDRKGNPLPIGKHHNSRAGRHFHNKLIRALKKAKTKQEALDIIKEHHDRHMRRRLPLVCGKCGKSADG